MSIAIFKVSFIDRFQLITAFNNMVAFAVAIRPVLLPVATVHHLDVPIERSIAYLLAEDKFACKNSFTVCKTC